MFDYINKIELSNAYPSLIQMLVPPNILNLIVLHIGDYDELQNLSFFIPFQDKNVFKLDYSNKVKKDLALIEKYASQLVYLDCQRMGVVDLPDLPKVRYLDCSRNYIWRLPDLPEVVNLLCGYNQQLSFASVPILPEVTFLSCPENQLVQVLPALPKVKILVCFDCTLTFLPDLPNVELLSCAHNWITALPALPKISVLHCSCNRLTSLPDMPPTLVSLTCFENRALASLPDLPNVKDLRCFSCSLTSLPDLPEVEYLDCSKNRLTSLPDLPKIKELKYSENQISLFTSLRLYK
jgi:Leucine-rich repeat (LRR) protein